MQSRKESKYKQKGNNEEGREHALSKKAGGRCH